MSITLDAAASSATANSYVTVAEMDTYCEQRLASTAWTAEADVEKKKAALIEATNRLETERYKGEKTQPGQRLKWPRVGVIDEDGYEYAGNVVPLQMKQAQMEQALTLLASGTTDWMAETGLEGYSSVQVSSVSVDLRHDGQTFAGQLPAAVSRLISWFKAGGSGGPRLSRG